MTRPLLCLALAMMLAGCEGRTMAVLKNPKTGETAQCQSNAPFVHTATVDKCVEAYERDGWVKM